MSVLARNNLNYRGFVAVGRSRKRRSVWVILQWRRSARGKLRLKNCGCLQSTDGRKKCERSEILADSTGLYP